MENTESENFRQFRKYVFGDYRYFYYNGMPEELFTSLSEPEKATAEKLVLKAVKKRIIDERAIRAAGYLRLEAAAPVLEKKLNRKILFNQEKIQEAIKWALLKIKPDKELPRILINVVYGRSTIKDLTRLDAINLLSDYADEPEVVRTLLDTYLDEHLVIEGYSLEALRNMFKKDPYISNLLPRSIRPDYDKRAAVAYIKSYLKLT